MKKRSGLALFLAVPVLALGACGGGGNSDKDKITSIIEGIGKDPASLCDHAATTLLKQVGGTKESCQKAAKGATKNRDVKVESVDVNDDKATAKIKAAGGGRSIDFVKEGGEWKASASR